MKRNGKIELLRFVFSVILVMYHFDLKINKFPFAKFYPSSTTDFFFLLSGFLMAKSASKITNSDEKMGDRTATYIWKRILGFVPCYILSYILIFVMYCIDKNIHGLRNIIATAIQAIPDLLLMKEFGWFNDLLNINVPSWFLSSSTIAMAVIYPLCIKYDWFNKIGTFIFGSLLIGFIQVYFGSFASTHKLMFGGYLYKGFVRCFGEICLGVTCYHISKKIENTQYTKFGKLLLSLVEVYSLAFILYISFFNQSKLHIIAMIFTMIYLIIVFSNSSFNIELLNNKIIYYLGKLSLSIYLSHYSVFYLYHFLVKQKLVNSSDVMTFVCMVVLSVLIAVVIDVLSNLFRKKTSQLFLITEDV